ncbi:peptidyl-tRNA hydrolase, PTH1 family [Galdieria sulphuraria]|uniref:peptidyl-tRNA hydrolase n=1 Tax=Galdieria sulphuraria TaxID=130081 RepID=M2WVX2_GALSU|nr:peptidyl-tRNA hydrolase, PTH1 family [Galdieria sulphuraria]EME28140.1 peptidyl-tRNA hydrolase, PTH1 family [Galdieria sulphuraria]|eukprot:XP_005704660.1 peptidyl-tRNA hydrolase, PTH1 family [Galdieria sulphuraria]
MKCTTFVVVASHPRKTKTKSFQRYFYLSSCNHSSLKNSSSLPSQKCRECLIVGLGNPGSNLSNTRHNLGFDILDFYANRYSFTFTKDKYLNAEYACHLYPNAKVHFLKPMTFMNNSGQSIAAMMRRIAFSTENILVIVDDMSLPFGQTRLRLKGSNGGHNGLKSVEKVLGSNQYVRLRVGIDSPKGDVPAQVYVLSPFSPVEKKQLVDVFW